MWTEVLGWTFNAKDMVHYVYLKSIWNHLEATSMNYLQVVFAFFFQGEVLHETASDQLSQLGAALISAWGVVALTKETLAPEEDPKTEPLLKRWDEKIIREDMRSTSIWLIEIPKCMPKCWRSEVIRRGDKKWETKVGLNVLYRLVFCLSIRQATGRDNSSARHLVVEHTKIMSAGCDLQDIFIPCDLGWKLKKTGKETAVERVLKLNLPKQVWGPFIVWPVLWTFFWLCTQFAISELESQSWKSTSFAAAVDWFFGLLIWIMGYIDILLSFGLWEILVTPATGWKPKWHPLHTSPPFWIWYHPTNPTIPNTSPKSINLWANKKSCPTWACVFFLAGFNFGPNFKHAAPSSSYSVWPGGGDMLIRVDCPILGNSQRILELFGKGCVAKRSGCSISLLLLSQSSDIWNSPDISWLGVTDFGPSVTVQGIRIYKEIQIHGEVSLKRNVQRLVANKKPFDCTAFSCAESMPCFFSHATSHQQSIVILPKAPRSPNGVIKAV